MAQTRTCDTLVSPCPPPTCNHRKCPDARRTRIETKASLCLGLGTGAGLGRHNNTRCRPPVATTQVTEAYHPHTALPPPTATSIAMYGTEGQAFPYKHDPHAKHFRLRVPDRTIGQNMAMAQA